MHPLSLPLHRRSFLTKIGGWAAVATSAGLLGGCGGDSSTPSTASVPVAVATTAPAAPAAQAVLPTTDTGRLNFALNLHYLAAQFHGYAAGGGGLPPALLSGAGQQGSATGARAATLSDPIVVAAAAGLASDKQAQVTALRQQLGTAAAAMPAIDLTAGGAFARAAQAVGAGTIDPYADDTHYLIGAFLIDDALAAVQRALLIRMEAADATATLGDAMATSIHHGALLRTLIDVRAAVDPNVTATFTAASAGLATLDGSGSDDGMLADANAGSSNLVDAAGRPIPFTREPDQALKLAFVSASGTVGGFFPNGFNGVA